MKVMKPIASTQIPEENEWMYEVKYDGFRCILRWEKGKVRLTSKNNKDLTPNFPEIIEFCQKHQSDISSLLPLELDGELVVLNSSYQANFSWIQKRGRLKDHIAIKEAAQERPATFMAFDMLMHSDKVIYNKPFDTRKKTLFDFFQTLNIGFNLSSLKRICYVPYYEDPNELWKIIFIYKAEGMIAKRKNSVYRPGKNHNDWFKIKNWRPIHGILTFYDTQNDYFTVKVYDENNIMEIGKCKHGLDSEAFQTLKQVFYDNGTKQVDGYTLPPAICAKIHTLDLHKHELREPEFAGLKPNLAAPECTSSKLRLDMAMLPKDIELTNTDKVFWPKTGFTKGDLLVHLREIAPYMLPFLKDRALTLIRSPDGVNEESFFQKHLPEYAPDYIDSIQAGEEKLIICNKLETLVWFGNHGAVEYHVPFQKIESENPSEIVFDLDPPDRERFPLSIHAAKLLKQLLDELGLVSFVKTSGNKGLQVYIPIPENSMSYDETAIFTQAIAWTIEKEFPKHFTTERLKKNRHERLYIDYVQHGRDKTLIAPYSPRKTAEATVATPLYWDEVKEGLSPEPFTINNVAERVKLLGCPFTGYFEEGKKQDLEKVLALVKK
ncbi:DNA ligase D [Virgibacillus oceani]|uniref:DNA ligase (ATP) n=1 Tax=Virgibacillus oceani TaxID=1479511 RepID=A0A917H8M2_9BACI|nr:DNA ligase D [Virgibacillus oceani]GGG71009.1 bifunctional non-homologous end joining protein LigD [Virgibacillus oceani]